LEAESTVADSAESVTVTDEQPDLSVDALDDNIEINIDAEKDHEELEALRENGATPVTFPPENSSYLEEDDHINLDLSEAVIDEPELSTEGIDEPPITEPSLDIDSLDDLNISIDDSDVTSEDLASEDLASDDLSSADVPSEDVSADDSSIDDVDIDVAMPLGDVKDDEQDLSLDSGFQSGGDISIDDQMPEGFEDELQDASVPLEEAADTSDLASSDLTSSDLTSVEDAEPAEITAGDESAEDIDKIEEIGEIDDVDEIADIDEKPAKAASAPSSALDQKGGNFQLPSDLKKELKNILSYMDQLLESLPEEKIEEFAKSEYFDSYKKLFKDLGLV